MVMIKNLLLLAFAFILANNCVAQPDKPVTLEQRIAGKTNFYDLKNEVTAFYKVQTGALRPAKDSTNGKDIKKQLKRWNRWFYESESRLDENGKVANASQRIYDVLQQQERPSALTGITQAWGSWTFAGPDYVEKGIGRINCIAFHPSNANIIFAGSAAGGLWKSTNAGSSWSCITSYTPSLGVSGIVISKNNPDIIYVLSGDGDQFNGRGFGVSYGYVRFSVGILKTTDGGLTWSKTSSLGAAADTTQYVGFKLLQDPNNDNILIAATSVGIFRTSDGGNTWQPAFFRTTNYDFSQNNRKCYDIEFKPGSSSVLYAAYQTISSIGEFNDSANLFRSTDGGATFIRQTHFSGVSRMAIAVTPANPNYVYLLCGPGYVTEKSSANNTFKGIYKSADGGTTFTLQTDHPDILGFKNLFQTQTNQSTYDLAFAASPVNANLLITGALTGWRSTDGGVNLTEIIDYYWDLNNGNYIHPDIHDMAYNPLNGKLYACTDGGVSVSSDNGNGWVRLFNGLATTQFYHFSLSNWSGQIWGGAQDNGILQRSTGNNFDHYAQGDGYDVMKVNVNGANDFYFVVNTDVFKYGGVSDATITPPGFANQFFPNLAHHPTKANVIYAGFYALNVSDDKGSTWHVTLPPANWCLSACPTRGDRVYSAGKSFDAKLYRIDNLITAAGAYNASHQLFDLTPALQAAGYPDPASGVTPPKITGIAVSQTDANIIAVTVGGYLDHKKVFISYNAGSSFQNISGDNTGTYAGLPNLPANCVTFDSHGGLYIGTDIGVYYKVNGYSQWTPFYNGLPRVPVSQVIFQTVPLPPPNNPVEYIYASTYGRGIWYSQAYSDCPSALTVTAGLSGQQFFQAAATIGSSSVITGGVGTNVNMKAGSVTLTEGFNAQVGNEFRAYTGICSIGLPVDNLRPDSSAVVEVITLPAKAMQAKKIATKSKVVANKKMPVKSVAKPEAEDDD